MKYDKSSINSTMEAARACAQESRHTQYVFATGVGFTVAKTQPPFKQNHYQVYPDGSVNLFAYDAVKGDWQVESRS